MREIAKKKEIRDKDIDFLVRTAKERERLAEMSNFSVKEGGWYKKLVDSAARDEFGDAVYNVLSKIEERIMAMERGERLLAEEAAQRARDHDDTSRAIKKAGADPWTVITHSKLMKPENVAEALELPENLVKKHVKAYEEYERSIDEYYKHKNAYRAFLDEVSRVFEEAPLIYHVYVARKGGKLHPKLDESYLRAMQRTIRRKMEELQGH